MISADLIFSLDKNLNAMCAWSNSLSTALL